MKIYQDCTCIVEYQYVFCIPTEEGRCSYIKPGTSYKCDHPINKTETLIYEVDHGKKQKESFSQARATIERVFRSFVG